MEVHNYKMSMASGVGCLLEVLREDKKMKQNLGRSEAMYFEGKWMFHFSVSSYWSW